MERHHLVLVTVDKGHNKALFLNANYILSASVRIDGSFDTLNLVTESLSNTLGTPVTYISYQLNDTESWSWLEVCRKLKQDQILRDVELDFPYTILFTDTGSDIELTSDYPYIKHFKIIYKNISNGALEIKKMLVPKITKIYEEY